jgi:hypothetical protein
MKRWREDMDERVVEIAQLRAASHIEWVVYACPKCGIQHDPGDVCHGMLTDQHEPITVERVVIAPALVKFILASDGVV